MKSSAPDSFRIPSAFCSATHGHCRLSSTDRVTQRITAQVNLRKLSWFQARRNSRSPHSSIQSTRRSQLVDLTLPTSAGDPDST